MFFVIYKQTKWWSLLQHGRQLLVNYRSLLEECQLSNCERVNVAPSHAATRLSTISTGSSLLDATSESGSSGCDVGFECDFPSGTIKRKPPKIPLTATTRQLKEIAVGNPTKHIERAPSFESLPPPPPEVLENLIHPDEDLPPPPPPPPRLAPPSTAFLQDLQRVMRRKWQVAQKCKLDQTTTPHEVLGFRDVPDYKETNVSNWVAEHYGGQNLYENVYRPGGIQIAPGIQLTPVKKRPPPPPPRAETTQLSTNRHPQKCWQTGQLIVNLHWFFHGATRIKTNWEKLKMNHVIFWLIIRTIFIALSASICCNPLQNKIDNDVILLKHKVINLFGAFRCYKLVFEFSK